MKKKIKIALLVLFFVAAFALFLFYVFTHDMAVMNPKGMIGIKERDLIITASLLMLIVVIPVLILTFIFAWKYRASNGKSTHAPDWEHNYIAEFCWWGVPLVIIIILAIITYRSSHELNPFKAIETPNKTLKIQVVALQWKWLFIYPEQGIATVNYAQFPEKTAIYFEISADAPMNSFWIPQLGGQIYAMPGMRSKLYLVADEIGTYRGVSANISGTGFAGMTFNAKATSQGDFDNWVSSVKSSAPPLTMDKYNQLVMPSENNPVATYTLSGTDLFDRILMKYMEPAK